MKGFLYSNQDSLFGQPDIIGFGQDDFNVKEIDRNLANKIIVNNHYSGKFYSATYIHLGIFINGEMMGVLQLGYAMNPASMDSVVSGTCIDEYLELNRMWLSDEAPKNSESKSLSFAIKYIKRKYPKIKWIQSFADERCGGFGIVYQAANFEYYGEHSSIFWFLDDEVFHNSLMTRNPNLSKSAKFIQDNKYRATKQELRQFRYLFFIDKRQKKNCLLKQCQPIKHYQEKLI